MNAKNAWRKENKLSFEKTRISTFWIEKSTENHKKLKSFKFWKLSGNFYSEIWEVLVFNKISEENYQKNLIKKSLKFERNCRVTLER